MTSYQTIDEYHTSNDKQYQRTILSAIQCSNAIYYKRGTADPYGVPSLMFSLFRPYFIPVTRYWPRLSKILLWFFYYSVYTYQKKSADESEKTNISKALEPSNEFIFEAYNVRNGIPFGLFETSDTIFVAVRGTTSLYDWMHNFGSRQETFDETSMNERYNWMSHTITILYFCTFLIGFVHFYALEGLSYSAGETVLLFFYHSICLALVLSIIAESCYEQLNREKADSSFMDTRRLEFFVFIITGIFIGFLAIPLWDHNVYENEFLFLPLSQYCGFGILAILGSYVAPRQKLPAERFHRNNLGRDPWIVNLSMLLLILSFSFPVVTYIAYDNEIYQLVTLMGYIFVTFGWIIFVCHYGVCKFERLESQDTCWKMNLRVVFYFFGIVASFIIIYRLDFDLYLKWAFNFCLFGILVLFYTICAVFNQYLVCFPDKPRVHGGFFRLARYIYPELKPLLELKGIEKEGGKKIIFCGHSLGGAVAHLLARMISLEYKDNKIVMEKICCYTFGSPFVGDRRFANTEDNKLYKHFVNGDDIVPRMLVKSTIRLFFQASDHLDQLMRLVLWAPTDYEPSGEYVFLLWEDDKDDVKKQNKYILRTTNKGLIHRTLRGFRKLSVRQHLIHEEYLGFLLDNNENPISVITDDSRINNNNFNTINPLSSEKV